MDEKTFKRNPRDYAIELAESIGWQAVCEAFIHSLSHDDIRDCLDANEMSPRFMNDEDEESESDEEEHHCYYSFGEEGWAVILQGIPVCNYKYSMEDAAKAAKAYDLTPTAIWDSVAGMFRKLENDNG